MNARVASVLAVAVVAAGVAWPGTARAVSFLDESFPGGEWNATKTFDSTIVSSGIDNRTIQLHPTPEPTTIVLLGSSLAGLGAAAAWRRRSRRR